MSDDKPHAKVNVVAPDGTVEDSVKVQFDYEQPVGIEPLSHVDGSYFPSDYSLELVYIHVDGKHITAND